MCFLIVGGFPNPALKAELLAILGVQCCFLGNQAFGAIPLIVAMADLCVLPQSATSLAAQFQTSAKLVGALAMGVPVITTATPALAPVLAAGAAIAAETAGLAQQLQYRLAQPEARAQGKVKRGGRIMRRGGRWVKTSTGVFSGLQRKSGKRCKPTKRRWLWVSGGEP